MLGGEFNKFIFMPFIFLFAIALIVVSMMNKPKKGEGCNQKIYYILTSLTIGLLAFSMLLSILAGSVLEI